MAGKNSPFPYNEKGNNKAYFYLLNVFYRDKHYDLPTENINDITSKYGTDMFINLGRTVKNLTDIMDKLSVHIKKIDENKFKITNSYIKVYNRYKTLNRTKDIILKDKNIFIIDNNKLIPIL